MKNMIMFYYNLHPNSIHQIQHKYWFVIKNIKYLFIEYEGPIKNVREILELQKMLVSHKIPVHEIIQNKENQIVTRIEQKNFIMMKQNVKDGNISIGDLSYFSKATTNLFRTASSNQVKKLNWNMLWSSKIDYFEYQISQFGMKYPHLKECFDYFVGLTENAIAFANNIKSDLMCINHQRIKNTTTYEEFYNPLSMMIDYRARDIAEYFKYKIFYTYLSFSEIEYYLRFNLQVEEYLTFYARMLFPTPFFDRYEEIIKGKKDENVIIEIIKKIPIYEKFLKEIYFFISNYTTIPTIDWIIKVA